MSYAMYIIGNRNYVIAFYIDRLYGELSMKMSRLALIQMDIHTVLCMVESSVQAHNIY